MLMNEIFLIFLSLSVSGSLIALLLFLLKPVIKSRLSKTWQYYIFLVVVLRLLLPFGPDTSLMGIVFNQVEDYAVEGNFTAMRNRDNRLLLPEGTTQEQVAENTVIPSSPGKNIEKILMSWLWLGWLGPAALLLFRKTASYRHYIRSVKNGCSFIADVHMQDICREICQAMGMKHTPGLARNEQVAAPMLIGIIQPIIVLPDVDLKDTDMRYIFQHELTHYKRLDIVYKWLVLIALCLHWFNPVLYWINREINRNCELSCDEAVIRQLDKKSKYAYGDMLLSAIKLEKMGPRETVSITLSEDTKLIKERLGAIMAYKKQSRIITMLSVFLAALLICGATFTGVYAAKPASQDANTLRVQGKNTAKVSNITSAAVPITIDEVEMRYYEDKNPNGRWPYIHWIVNNNSDKTITDYEMMFLAYDKDGNPMKLIWRQLALTDGNLVTGYTSQSDKLYEQLITLADQPILPGAKEDPNGGWSLWDGWNQARGTHEVAYVLACMKQVTFKDGEVWKNPEYKRWLSKYKGNAVDVEALADYY